MKWLWLSYSEMVLSETKSDVWSILLGDVFFIACNLVNVLAKRGPHPCVLLSIWKRICARHLLPILRNYLVQLSSVHNMCVPLYTRNIIDFLYKNLVFVQQSCFFLAQFILQRYSAPLQKDHFKTCCYSILRLEYHNFQPA